MYKQHASIDACTRVRVERGSDAVTERQSDIPSLRFRERLWRLLSTHASCLPPPSLFSLTPTRCPLRLRNISMRRPTSDVLHTTWTTTATCQRRSDKAGGTRSHRELGQVLSSANCKTPRPNNSATQRTAPATRPTDPAWRTASICTPEWRRVRVPSRPKGEFTLRSLRLR